MRYVHLLFILTFAIAAPIKAATTTPNIILILVDDQGYYDLSCYGATEIQTPHIDRLAHEGIRFTDYYAAAPICSPSRAGLLTGCYPKRLGLATWVHRADSKNGIHPDELTLGELFQQNAYRTACIGKWHLGFQPPFLPAQQGFHEYFGLLHNLDPVEIIYFKDQGGVPLMRSNQVVKRPPDPAELTRRYTDEAIAFIQRNHTKPFFLYLAHTMLHNPLGVSAEFKGTSSWGEYGDAIHELDHNVGRLHQTVTDLGLAEQTVIVYLSDNGRGPGRTPDQPIRGRKLSTFEGGIRVPGIVWGPGLGVRQNHVSAAPVRAMDWYPTLATLAHLRVPEGPILDGRDLSPLLTGKTDTVPAPNTADSLNADIPLRRPWNPPGEWAPLISQTEYHNAFFYHGSHGSLAAVRWEQWKLYLNPSLTLYNLAEDPGERRVVRNGAIQRKLRGMAILFQEEMRDHARPVGFAP